MEIGDLLLSILLGWLIVLQIIVLIRLLISQYKTDKMKKELHEVMIVALHDIISEIIADESD